MDVKDLRRRIAKHFYDLVDEDANPLVVALALQDNSSVGLQRHAAEFRDLHDELQNFLKLRVDENYDGFIESAGVFRYVVEALKAGNDGVQGAKSQLAKLHGELSQRKDELQALHAQSLMYQRKLELLDQLDALKQLPSRYEAAVARKEFTQARHMLEEVLGVFNQRSLLGHPAVKPLIGYVQTQQVQLVARLTDELRQTASAAALRPDYTKTLLQDDAEYAEFMKSLPTLPPIDPARPEEHTLAYMAYVMQTLAGLGGLVDALDSLQRRVEFDLQAAVATTKQQVIRDLKVSPEQVERALRGHTLLDQFRLIDQGAISVLAKAVFARLVKALEHHRVVSEIAALFGIEYDFDAVCETINSIAKAFLVEYVGHQATTPATQSAAAAAAARAAATASEHESRFSKAPQGPLFEFGPGDEDQRSLRDFAVLRDSLKKTVPGLLADDPNHLFAETREKQQLEVVAPTHILNIRPLLEPTAAFFAKARSYVTNPRYERLFDNFLELFLQQTFVPRLQEAFEDAIAGIAEEDSALEQMEDFRRQSQLPIVNAVSEFMETIGLLSQILDTGTRFRPAYADMLVGLLESITSFFQTQVANLFEQPTYSRSGFRLAAFTAQPAFQQAIRARYRASMGGASSSAASSVYGSSAGSATANASSSSASTNANHTASLGGAESDLYFGKRHYAKPKVSVSIQDLLDAGMFRRAALLVSSIRWMVLRLQRARAVDQAGPEVSGDRLALRSRRWTVLDAAAPGAALERDLLASRVLLAGRSLAAYDGVIAKLEECVLTILSTLRADLFLRIVHYFDRMFLNRDFHSTNRGEERDPMVDRLQHELSAEAQVFEEHLLPSDTGFLLSDIAEFMTQLFILEGENIRDMNESGQNQILTNIFALQQMLTSIVADPREVDFSRASGFYELFRLNPTLIIDKAKDGETDLGKEDLRLLLAIRHRNAGSTSHAFGTLANHIALLDQVFAAASSSSASAPAPPATPTTPATPATPASSAGASTRTARSTGSTPSQSRPTRSAGAANGTSASNGASTSSASTPSASAPSVTTSSASSTPAGRPAAPPSPARVRQGIPEGAKPSPTPARSAAASPAAAASVSAPSASSASITPASSAPASTFRPSTPARSAGSSVSANSDKAASINAAPASSVATAPARALPTPTPAAAPAAPAAAAAAPVVTPVAAPAAVPVAPTAVAPTTATQTTAAVGGLPRRFAKSAGDEIPPRGSSERLRASASSDRLRGHSDGAAYEPPVPAHVQPLRQRASTQQMRVNTQLASAENLSGANSPITPDQPTGRPRPRTPSERALEAAQRVRVRPLPQNTPRR